MKLGALTYRTRNLGDDIQTISAMQYLEPEVFIDRDKIATEEREIKLIGNGYWDMRSFPPKSNIQMLPISMHIPLYELEKKDIDWFKRNEPIGCRDLHTERLLKSYGVEAYFSGCLTLTLPKYDGKREDYIVVVGKLPKSWYNDIRGENIIDVRQYITDEKLINNPEARIKQARKNLEIYKKAKLVLTSRIHTAFPCIAIGTPVALDITRGFERLEGYDWIPRHKEIDLKKDYTIERPEEMIAKLKEKVANFLEDDIM